MTRYVQLRRRGWWVVCLLLLAWVLGVPVSCAAAPARSWVSAGPAVRTLGVAPDAAPKASFERLAGARTGVLFTNLLSDQRSITNRNLLSGSGVAAGDVNGDGWVDIFFCGLDTSNRLYLNQGGWRFVDGTEAAGLGMRPQDSTASALVDMDGDGDLDLLVASLGGGVRLFLNDSQGVFRDVTAEAGLGSRAGSMALAVADVEGDGDLDLYVANFRPSTIRDMPQTKFLVNMVDGAPVISAVNGVPASHPDLHQPICGGTLRDGDGVGGGGPTVSE